MKIKLITISILMTTLLFACQKKQHETKQQIKPIQPTQQKTTTPQPQQPDVHKVVIQKVTQATSYTYLKVKEGNDEFWVAIRKAQIEAGEIISFANPLKMTDFTSKDLQKTFEEIYFIGGYKKDGDPTPETATPQTKPAIEKKEISIEQAQGGITIGELFSNKDNYAGKTVIIKGQVVKFSKAIMAKNWVHLQDGTESEGRNDLTITTQDTVAVGDVVTFEGKITLNKDFGAGYKYDVMMEEAKKK